MHPDSSSTDQTEQYNLEQARQRLLRLLLAEEGLGDLSTERIAPREHTVQPVASFAQERVWFLSQWDTASCLYNIPLALRLRGKVQVRRLEQSLNEIVRRHEVLRHRFLAEGGCLKLQIAPFQSLDITCIHLEHLSAGEQEVLVKAILQAEMDTPFDLVQGPLLRPALIQLDQDEYLFSLVFHHIAFDDWSPGILLRELSLLYTSLCEQRLPQLPTLSIQYADFAAWQRQRLQGEQLAELQAYWRAKLGGVLPLLQLPTDYPRPALATDQGGQQTCVLSPALSEALRGLSREKGVTHFVTLLAAYATLLYRYTAQEDLLIGTPVVNRDRAEISSLIGYFGNMLVLRLRVAGENDFLTVLREAQQVCLDAFAHQDFPFEKLVEELHPERSTSHTPLFQTVFSLRTDASAELQLGDLQVSLYEIARRTARYDLAMEVVETESSFVISLNYKSELFDAATIASMLEHYRVLLEDIVTQPSRRVTDLSLLTSSEYHQLVDTWNATDVAYPLDQCVQHVFERQAEQSPAFLAVISADRSLTYGELNRQANQLAHYLRRFHVGPGAAVGICLERSPAVVIGVLAVLKAGAAFLLLDPSYPAERLAFMLADAQVSVMLAQQGTQISASTVQHTIDIEADWPLIAQESEQNPVHHATAEDLAYLIYTSGSTGTPKGVMISHRSLCNRLLAVGDFLQVTPQDRFLQKTPYAFDVAIGELLTPRVLGATLVLARPQGHLDPRYLLDIIVQQEITYVHFVPSMLRLFLEQDLSPLRESRLKHVWCGGEALPLDLQEAFFQRLPAKLYNGYGPSETTIGVTCCVCEPGRARKRVSIGHPLANTYIYILDAALNPVPQGVIGELYVGGVQVARGYLGHADLTQERFLPNPFRPEAGARMYRTGDFARYLEDGAIEFLGRIDTQVKIRGVRIELAEIEAALVLHPAVKQALVIARTDASNLPFLVAYLVPVAGQHPDPQELRGFLQKKLPEYMLPATFIALDALPLLENGKVNLALLPSPVRTRDVVDTAYTAPRNQLEQQIAAIWCDLLGVERAGIHDNFFDLGGYSLLLLRFQNRLREELHQELSMVELYQAPTISALANALQQGKEAAHTPLQQSQPLQESIALQKSNMSKQREKLKNLRTSATL